MAIVNFSDLTEKELAIVDELQRHIEHEATGPDGRIWARVYIPNIDFQQHGLTPKGLGGVLSSLATKGIYRNVDDPDYRSLFGEILLLS